MSLPIDSHCQSPNRAHYLAQARRPAGMRPKPKMEETIMSGNEQVENYIESDEERERGHEDTRHKNFECENKTSYGCDPGIDVAG
jgi:hypothetical protein